MGDIKLFHIQNGLVEQLASTSATIEKDLQNQVEKHLDAFLGVRLLASEYSTGQKHGGRIDTLGIDENGVPVIIEYKRKQDENVISQGLYYLSWLMDHRGEFRLLVQEKVGRVQADSIDWSSPRILCIAGDFTKFDVHAVGQINHNIDLIRYRRYGDKLLLLELVNERTETAKSSLVTALGGAKGATQEVDASKGIERATPELRSRYEELKRYLLNLGDDVQERIGKSYISFQRMKNFVIVEIRVQSGTLAAHIRLQPDLIKIEQGFTRDVTNKGYFGGPEVQITIHNDEELEKAKPLLQKSYELN